MNKRIALSFFSLALAWAHVSQAIVTPLVLARQELVSFQKSIKQALVSYRMDQQDDESEQERSLASCITDCMPHALQRLPEHDMRNLHIAAVHLDTIFSNPISDNVMREKAVSNISRTLLDQTDELLCQLGAASKHAERHVSQQLSKQQKKLLAQHTIAQRAQASQRQQGRSGNDQQAGEDEQVSQEGGADIITWLTNNPEKVALGVAAAYGLLARYFEWPPFNKKNEAPQVQAQQPAQDYESDEEVWSWGHENDSANQDAPAQSEPEVNTSQSQGVQPSAQWFSGNMWNRVRGLFRQ